MEKLIESLKGINWEAVGAFIVVIGLAIKQTVNGIIVARKPSQIPQTGGASPHGGDDRLQRGIEELIDKAADIKADTRQLGRDRERDHETLDEIRDTVKRIERKLP